MARFEAAVFVLLLAPSIAGATTTPCEPVDEKSILGIWETVETTRTLTLLRLELNDRKPSTLIQGYGSSLAIVSLLSATEVKRGRVKLRFAHRLRWNPGKNFRRGPGEIAIEGYGEICAPKAAGGFLDVTLTDEPGTADAFDRRLRFYRVTGSSLVRELRDASKTMDQAIRAYGKQ